MTHPGLTRPACSATQHALHRRGFLGGLLAGATASLCAPGLCVAGETPASEALRKEQRRVLFIWLAGGASQFEMWDPKPGRETGGPFRSIPTAVPGYLVCELMPLLAANGLHLLDRTQLTAEQKSAAKTFFQSSVFPALTPLAVGHSEATAQSHPPLPA